MSFLCTENTVDSDWCRVCGGVGMVCVATSQDVKRIVPCKACLGTGKVVDATITTLPIRYLDAPGAAKTGL